MIVGQTAKNSAAAYLETCPMETMRASEDQPIYTR